MGRVFLFYIFVFFFRLSWAQEAYPSFVCGSEALNYRGVSCCLEDLSSMECKQEVDSLPEHILRAVNQVQEMYFAGDFEYGKVPNCYWGASYFLDLIPKDRIESLNSFQIEDLLQESHSKTQQLKRHSAILFYAKGLTRSDGVSDRPGGKLKLWAPFSFLSHAAIYLENGLIFQKEDIKTQVFSISSLALAQKRYAEVLEKSSMYRKVSIDLKFWEVQKDKP